MGTPNPKEAEAAAVGDNPIKVLVIDDDPFIRGTLEDFLSLDGFSVITASDGEEGLNRIDQDDPDVVVLDVMMPGMSGLDVLKEARERFPNRTIPILILTGASDTSTLIEAFEAGADDFVSKPFQYPVIAARLRTQAARKLAEVARQKLLDSLELQVKIRTTDLEIRNSELESEIQRRRQVEFAMEAAKADADQHSDAKLRVLQSMSHELGTPIQSIKALAGLMVSEVYGPLKPPEYGGHAQDIAETCEQLEEFLENILGYTQSGFAGGLVHVEDSHVMSLAKRALKLLSYMCESKNVTVDICSTCDLSLMADPTMLVRILTNLLSNAIRHSPPGSVVRVTAQTDGSDIVVKVADEGQGIDPEQIEDLMAPFEQTDQHIVKDKENTGLGLSVSRYLAHLHQGELTLDSAPGAGTTALLRLPREQDQPAS